MLKCLLEAHSSLRFSNKQFSDKVLDSLRQVFWELEVDVEDFAIGFLSTLGGFERSMASAQLIAKYSYAPDINQFIIFASHDDFRRDII